MASYDEKFGPKFSSSPGFIVEAAKDARFGHKFGGSTWDIVDAQLVDDGPALLLTLDLSDPKLSEVSPNGLLELPIVSYINNDIWLEEQTYKIEPSSKTVTMLRKSRHVGYTLSGDDKLPQPLPERQVTLRPMNSSEYPTDEGLYWENTDEFLGGKSFLRVVGHPLWTQNECDVACRCGEKMTFVLGLGYEGWEEPFIFMEDQPLFLGEAALYAFYCDKCLELKMISQSS